ncbi:MAG: exodeoxyribonuclease VII small subunit [Gemmataceae bacterium]|nr:exodeoxyribonuclease VII small subunit [Gemmataceae bacterium]
MSHLAEPKTFEDSLVELERIVLDLEAGETGLDQALARYEQGVGLIRRCYDQLRKAELRILEVTGKDEAGNPLLRPFEHTSAVKANG